MQLPLDQHFPQHSMHAQHKAVLLVLQVGSVEDNGSGGTYAYRASKSALNIGVMLCCDPQSPALCMHTCMSYASICDEHCHTGFLADVNTSYRIVFGNLASHSAVDGSER